MSGIITRYDEKKKKKIPQTDKFKQDWWTYSLTL